MKNHVLPAEETNPNSLGLSEGDLPPEEKKEESSDDKEKGEVKE
jgi:hypothetical protein